MKTMKMKKPTMKKLGAALLAATLFTGFGAVNVETVQAAVLVPTAAGINTAANAQAEIDYSHARYGYVKVRFLQPGATSVRVIIDSPGGRRYQYRLNTNGDWEVFPLSEGNGSYTIGVFEQVQGNRFAQANTVTINVSLVNEFAPFLRPNQFVNFNARSRVVAVAADVTRGSTSMLDSVSRVFNFVIENIEYDTVLAQTVQSGYVPDVDRVLERGMGICFDYAAVMTAMLRSQGIPTQLVIGYVGDVYHAWISVYSEETGWINDMIQFDGNEWRIMDPTFAATGGQAEAAQFVGTGANHNPTRFH